MAQLQEETRITEKSSDPLKVTHEGEREESQQQQQPSAPSSQTKPTQIADDLNDQPEVHQPQKKSILQKVKDTALTLIQKHVPGYGNDHREKEDHHQFEDEEDHNNFRQEEKEDTEGEKKEEAQDLNSSFNSRPDTSAVSPGFYGLSTGNLSNDSDVARDQEVTNTVIQWTSDAKVVVVDYEPGSASDSTSLPVETTRGQQKVATDSSQQSDGITSILQSTEAASTVRPFDDVQTVSCSDKYVAHQVNDIGITDALNSVTHPIQSEFSQELLDLLPSNSREEAPENELYGKDEPEKIDYNDSFDRASRVPDGMIKPITEEPAVDTVPIQDAAEDRWFDADDAVAGAPAVKDQDPSLSHVGSEEFGLTEPISDKVEFEEDKDGVTDIKRHADAVSDELQDLRAQMAERLTVSGDESIVGAPIVKDQNPTVNHVGSGEFGSTENNYAKDKLEGEHQSLEEASYKPDEMAEEDKYENCEKGKSYGDEIYDTDSKEKNEISSNLRNDSGQYEVAVQEEAEKRTERSRADDEKGVHEERRESLRDTPYAAESVILSIPVMEDKAEGQNEDDDGGEQTVEDEEIQAAEKKRRD